MLLHHICPVFPLKLCCIYTIQYNAMDTQHIIDCQYSYAADKSRLVIGYVLVSLEANSSQL